VSTEKPTTADRTSNENYFDMDKEEHLITSSISTGRDGVLRKSAGLFLSPGSMGRRRANK
jgi:hypothetical protein